MSELDVTSGNGRQCLSVKS